MEIHNDQLNKLIKKGSKPVRFKTARGEVLYGIELGLAGSGITADREKHHPVNPDGSFIRNVKVSILSGVHYQEDFNPDVHYFVTGTDNLEYITPEELIAALLLEQ